MRPITGFLFLACVAMSNTVHAQDARELFEAGVAAFDSGNYETALENFERAYEARPHPSVLANIANCHVELHHPLEASRYFQRFLDESEAIDPATRREIDEALGNARAEIATISVEGPDGVEVVIDGEVRGTTPVEPIDVNPGERAIELRHEGSDVQQERVTLAPGGSHTVTAAVVEHEEPVADVEDGSGFSVPIATWVLGGVAVAALAGGIAFGLTALSQQSDVEDLVARHDALPRGHPDRPRLREEAQSADDSRAVSAVLSDVLLISAAAAAATAVVLLFVMGGDDEPVASASITPDGAALFVRTGF